MAVLATDDFNRADENPLSGGGVWTSPFGTTDALKIVTNAVQAVTPGDDCGSTYTGIAWPNDQYGQVVCTNLFGTATNETGAGIALRFTTTGNFYLVVANQNVSNNVTVAKHQSSVYSVLQQFTATVNDGDTLYAEVQGTTLKAFVNGVQIGTDVSDPTTTLTAGNVGMFFSGPTALGTIVDSFVGGDFAGASPPHFRPAMTSRGVSW